MKTNNIRYHITTLAILAVSFFSGKLAAQTYSYPEYDMEGDTIWHSFPPPDSTYVHTELMLKFRMELLARIHFATIAVIL
jgi:hypothetical protein